MGGGGLDRATMSIKDQPPICGNGDLSSKNGRS